jgi:hypothetical protein
MSSPLEQDFDIVKELKQFPIEMDEWDLPTLDNDDPFDAAGARILIDTANENGIEIEGRLVGDLQLSDDYYLEAHKRAVVAAIYHEGIRHLRDYRIEAAQTGLELPPLDLDSLDLRNLAIVRLELPERDRFVFSLENKDDLREVEALGVEEARTGKDVSEG